LFPTGPVPVVNGFENYNGRRPRTYATGPVPVVDGFEDYGSALHIQ